MIYHWLYPLADTWSGLTDEADGQGDACIQLHAYARSQPSPF